MKIRFDFSFNDFNVAFPERLECLPSCVKISALIRSKDSGRLTFRASRPEEASADEPFSYRLCNNRTVLLLPRGISFQIGFFDCSLFSAALRFTKSCLIKRSTPGRDHLCPKCTAVDARRALEAAHVDVEEWRT